MSIWASRDRMCPKLLRALFKFPFTLLVSPTLAHAVVAGRIIELMRLHISAMCVHRSTILAGLFDAGPSTAIGSDHTDRGAKRRAKTTGELKAPSQAAADLACLISPLTSSTEPAPT
jgi:hypothetical protein